MKRWKKIVLIGGVGCGSVLLIGILALIGGFLYLRHTLQDKKVHEATLAIPELPRIDIAQPERFLNDLMLSPFWYVKKGRDGSFTAEARAIGPNGPSDGKSRFLFEFMADSTRSFPENYCIQNKNLEGDQTFSSFSATVVFRKPDLPCLTLGTSAQKAVLPVYDSFEAKMGLNSWSALAIKLSCRHEIYLVLREQGHDTERATTLAQILPAMEELVRVAESPETYRVEKRYADFFQTFLTVPPNDAEIKRFPGIQDRDTFYGCFRIKPGVSYAGINIKISHPVYCPDEGTRKHSRLEKAEYLGKPYQDGDRVFFLIEDNAVYLSGEYDDRFGIFTGKESFEGDLEVLNDQEVVLLKTKGPFKGWQR